MRGKYHQRELHPIFPGAYSKGSSGTDRRDKDNKSGDTDPRNYRVDFSKLKNFFLFTPNISVEEGVQEIIDNFRLFSGKEKKFFGNYEIK